jgi:proteasome accessory factor C
MGFLETSERTIYRYMDLLKELGFELEKDNANRFSIPYPADTELMVFTQEEKSFLEKLIRSAGKSNKLSDGILHKIYQGSDPEVGANAVFKVHLAKMVEQISIAIVEERQIQILNYTSANSESISHRLVEPMCFTDNYTSLSAFEVSSLTNKYFNIERMGSVEILENPMKHQHLHEFFKPDVFGFQGNKMGKIVLWEMGIKGATLLKEQYPMTSVFIHPSAKAGVFNFSAEVQDFRAPAGFALSLMDEVIILGSEDFKVYVQNLING